ncbi:MAG: DNA repair exonuclease [Pirellulales bacterium]|nr:DNA repair exonuclease [Pirellulales bacterium]
MKLFHTADWQIGMKAAHVGDAGERVRRERLAAGWRVVEAAREHGVDALLVAGDTFEDNAVERVLVQQVADILAEAPCPVFLIPGNHDPDVPGSVWEHRAWAAHDNLHVLHRAEPIALPGATLYPCPLHEKHSAADPTRWIDASGADGLAIGLAHGTVEGIAQDEPEHPIARDAAARAGLDYLALGHWHSFGAFDGRTAYSGTHETTKFGERDSGNALLVELTARGEPPVMTPVRTGGLRWASRRHEIRDENQLGQIRQEIEAWPEPGATLLDLRLSGVLPAGQRDELARIEELAAARFLYHRIDAAGLLPAPDDDGWLAGLADGPLKETARRLVALADPNTTDGGKGARHLLCEAPEGPFRQKVPGTFSARPDFATPEVAARALIELYALLGEGDR